MQLIMLLQLLVLNIPKGHESQDETLVLHNQIIS
jgi:hypothetical protein